MTTAVQEGIRSRPGIVTASRLVVALGVALAIVVAIAAAVGLFATGGPGHHEVLSLRGQKVDVYGTGLYRHDSWLIGVGNRGTDAVTLFLEIPALLIALVAYQRRSLRGTLVLVGVLGWLLYYYASMSLYASYNRMFPLYVVAFALALFAAPLALRSVDQLQYAAAFPTKPSRRLLVGYLGVLAVVLTVAWAPSMISAAVSGHLPNRLDVYSTEVTWTLDLAIVVPAVAATAVLLRRGNVFGPLAATAMLSLNVALGLALAGQGVVQLAADVPVKAGELVGAMASFAVMTIVAASLLIPLLRRLPSARTEEAEQPVR